MIATKCGACVSAAEYGYNDVYGEPYVCNETQSIFVYRESNLCSHIHFQVKCIYTPCGFTPGTVSATKLNPSVGSLRQGLRTRNFCRGSMPGSRRGRHVIAAHRRVLTCVSS